MAQKTFGPRGCVGSSLEDVGGAVRAPTCWQCPPSRPRSLPGVWGLQSGTLRGRATCPLQRRGGKEPVWGQNLSYVLNPEIGVSDLIAGTAKRPRGCTHALPSRVWTRARRVTNFSPDRPVLQSTESAGQSGGDPCRPQRRPTTRRNRRCICARALGGGFYVITGATPRGTVRSLAVGKVRRRGRAGRCPWP